MNKCSKCENSDSDLINCDKCNSKLCQSCTQLTSTELRAVLLKKRLIFFWCPECTANKKLQRTSQELCSIIANMEDNVTKYIANLQNQIIDLHNDLAILKETNIDLIKLLQNDNIKNNGIQARKLTTPTSTMDQDDPLLLSVKGILPENKTVAKEHVKGTIKPILEASKKIININKPKAKLNRSNKPDQVENLRKPESIIGTLKADQSNSKLVAAVINKKSSVQVKLLANEVTESDLLEHLQDNFGNETFTIEKLKVQSGDYASFRVEAREDISNQLLNPDLWPEGIIVNKFTFFRKNRTLYYQQRNFGRRTYGESRPYY